DIGFDTDSWGENWVAKREYLNFDLCIISNDEKQERLLAVIENKVKSIPTLEQLAKYNDKIIKKFGEETKPQRILLSLTESNIEIDDWRYVSYQSICEGLLKECFQSNFSGYSKELINDYANFVQALITLANIWKEDVVDNNTFLLNYNDRESKNEGENQEDVVSNNGQSINVSNKYSDAKELRIHDLYGKYRTAILKEKLEDRLKDEGLLEHPTLSITPQIAYSNSQPILEVMIKGIGESEDKSRNLDAEAFFISIQGNQYRHAINARDGGASTKDDRVKQSANRCKDIQKCHRFMNPEVHPNDANNDCFPKNDLLIESGQRKHYCSFAGRNGVNYIYQYRKISPNATVGNILEIVVEDVRNLLEQLNNQQ
ncbi:MAG: PD-(D/E)XK nuclease family protein, partial [Alistipes sp.]|nr:PD-(D/E)XK nuclease family protein [Alistipes sp.]